jgi:Family of unknown function (DUF6464)
VLQTLIAVVLITSFLMIFFWSSYRQRLRAHSRRMTVVESSSNRRFYKRMSRDPEEQYVEGVGYVIGDLTCSFNARSPYIRCAVNPDGLCQDCRHYHNRENN